MNVVQAVGVALKRRNGVEANVVDSYDALHFVAEFNVAAGMWVNHGPDAVALTGEIRDGPDVGHHAGPGVVGETTHQTINARCSKSKRMICLETRRAQC